jgi:hypothetical protein
MRRVLITLGLVVTGFMAGWLVGRQPSGIPGTAPNPKDLTAAACPAAEPTSPARPESQAALRNLAAAAAATDELERLRQENRRFQTELTLLRSQAALATAATKPIPFPPTLDARYREEALRDVFNQALAEAGITGELTTVDCKEFPCLVHGRLTSQAGMDQANADLRKLYELAGRRYPGDNFYLSQTEWKSPTGQEDALLFSASFYDKELAEELRRLIERRLRDRKNQYFDAAQGR